ncbi:hypothetical protein J27TS7_56360 [Paenibacillus dendritiformis]|nr:hypothetical protein J27TS7_56360 [Paenibacillus dendritiformis]
MQNLIVCEELYDIKNHTIIFYLLRTILLETQKAPPASLAEGGNSLEVFLILLIKEISSISL